MMWMEPNCAPRRDSGPHSPASRVRPGPGHPALERCLENGSGHHPVAHGELSDSTSADEGGGTATNHGDTSAARTPRSCPRATSPGNAPGASLCSEVSCHLPGEETWTFTPEPGSFNLGNTLLKNPREATTPTETTEAVGTGAPSHRACPPSPTRAEPVPLTTPVTLSLK